MSLENLIERIEKDTSKKAEKIKEEARETAKIILEEATAEAQEERENYSKQAKIKTALEKEAILARARLEARNLILKTKRNIFDKTFEDALKKLDKLKGKEYKELLVKLVLKYADGEETILMQDSLAEDIAQKANELLRASGKKASLKVLKEKVNGKGLILKNKEGVSINLSFDSIIHYQKRELEKDVFAMLQKD